MALLEDEPTEIANLRARLADAEATLDAIRSGTVDAFLGNSGDVLQLTGSETPYITFFDAMNEGGVTLDDAGRILYCNECFAQMAGRSMQQLHGKAVLSCIGAHNREKASGLLAYSTTGACDVELMHPNGSTRPVRFSFTRLDAGERRFLCLVVTDLTERMQVERDLERLVEERAGELRLAASVFENTLQGVIVTDMAGVILSVNPAFSEITGYSAGEAIGQKPSILRSQRTDPEFYQKLWTALLNEGHWRGEIWNRRKNGEAYLQWSTINLVPAQHGQPACYVAVFTDVTEFWRRDERIVHLAYHDPLTDLPNRTLLMDRLTHALAVAERQNERLGVLFIDLDGFKAVNDNLGHPVGDELLQEMARRLRAAVRSYDTVARIGGDEFVMIMEKVDSAEECAILADKLPACLAWEKSVGECHISVGASVGIAVYPEDGKDAATLLKNADSALYNAKSAGKGKVRYFGTSLSAASVR
jgi:diguanylate cyclase (GGDEF)-like protein/PAS domain S-box-containing protein